MQYVLLVVVLAGVAIGLGQVWLKRRREASLRRAIRSQNVTFCTRLPQVKVKEGYGWPTWLSLNSSMALTFFNCGSYWRGVRSSLGLARKPSRRPGRYCICRSRVFTSTVS